tara:strand:- start:5878 stop:6354 length:477 start_codon:yes stop_codon:yes gene_type:complete
MHEQRNSLSRHVPVAKAIACMLNDWPGFTVFLNDGRICLTNNAAERELRGVARGRKAWLFVGSDRGGERAAMMYSLIGTCQLNDVVRCFGLPMSSPASQRSHKGDCTNYCHGNVRAAPSAIDIGTKNGFASISALSFRFALTKSGGAEEPNPQTKLIH